MEDGVETVPRGKEQGGYWVNSSIDVVLFTNKFLNFWKDKKELVKSLMQYISPQRTDHHQSSSGTPQLKARRGKMFIHLKYSQ